MTNLWPTQTRAAMSAFYGDPDVNHDGVPDRAWEDANLTSLIPPYPMAIAWEPTQALKSIRCHKKVAESLGLCLSDILAHYKTIEAIRTARMHLYGGCYQFRLMRGGNMLSIHSWAAAIDLDPAANGFGTPWREGRGMMPLAVVEIFNARGWTWGGRWGKPDAMHMQAANI